MLYRPVTASSQKLLLKDFKPLEGWWSGQLSYMDYSSSKTTRIKAAAEVKLLDKNHFELTTLYPDEPSHNGTEVYTIGEDGNTLNDLTLQAKEKSGRGSSISFFSTGTDGNDGHPATIKYIWFISRKKFSITKLVKKDSEQEFFQRNKYEFTRNQ
jgi:hypothetical protein